uniref:phosphoethanolamine N-methyltransferase n=1 Tax=Mycena chlorophos TaxID=658473 RepID=A0ABQ0LVC2_MYCCL|nr:predicted protein [Mycena chlorophos]
MFLSALITVLVLAVAFWLVKRRAADPYGDFHIELNRVGRDATTEWLNMGWWKHTQVFPEACEALALKLVQAARLKPRSRVLDVGHGSGESLLFLLSHPSVPRPAHLTGITSLPAHHKRSQARLSRLNSTIPVVLHVGDAVYRPGVRDHPLNGPRFDHIVALDCAYHFNSRRDFMRQAFHALDQGGSLALADICFAPGTLQSLRTRCIMAVLRLMPSVNAISTDEYVAQMHEIGFREVELEDISVDVFPSFIAFLERTGAGWAIFGRVLGLYYSAGARFVVVRGTRM